MADTQETIIRIRAFQVSKVAHYFVKNMTAYSSIRVDDIILWLKPTMIRGWSQSIESGSSFCLNNFSWSSFVWRDVEFWNAI